MSLEVRQAVFACILLLGCSDTKHDPTSVHSSAGAGGAPTGGGEAGSEFDEPIAGAPNGGVGSGGEGGEGHQSGGAGYQSGGAAGEGGAPDCATESSVIPYEPEVTVASPNGMTVRLVRSTPYPHVGNHTWSLAISSAEGSAVEGATLRLTPFMPRHGHGSPLTARVEELGGGQYEAYPVKFTMAGYWRITVRVTSNDWTDVAVFPFCIE